MQTTLTPEAATNRTNSFQKGWVGTKNKNEDRRSFSSSGNVLSLSHVCECTCRSLNVATKHAVGRLHANALQWKTLFRSFGFLFLLRRMSSGNMSCSPRRLQDCRYLLSSLGLRLPVLNEWMTHIVSKCNANAVVCGKESGSCGQQ